MNRSSRAATALRKSRRGDEKDKEHRPRQDLSCQSVDIIPAQHQSIDQRDHHLRHMTANKRQPKHEISFDVVTCCLGHKQDLRGAGRRGKTSHINTARAALPNFALTNTRFERCTLCARGVYAFHPPRISVVQAC